MQLKKTVDRTDKAHVDNESWERKHKSSPWGNVTDPVHARFMNECMGTYKL